MSYSNEFYGSRRVACRSAWLILYTAFGFDHLAR